MMARTLKVNWPDVETAFERNSPALTSYVDVKTGDVVVLVDGTTEVEEQRRMVSEDPNGYVKIEPASSKEQYRWMEQFVATVADERLRERLLIATDGKGAFRRFKDVLLGYPEERERWFTYRSNLLHHFINEWVERNELEPDPPMPWGKVVRLPEQKEPLVRSTPDGDGPADHLRRQVKSLVDALPAGELHSARVFIEYLRDRGSAELDGTKGHLDPLKPFRRRLNSGDADPANSGDADPAREENADGESRKRANDDESLLHAVGTRTTA